MKLKLMRTLLLICVLTISQIAYGQSSLEPILPEDKPVEINHSFYSYATTRNFMNHVELGLTERERFEVRASIWEQAAINIEQQLVKQKLISTLYKTNGLECQAILIDTQELLEKVTRKYDKSVKRNKAKNKMILLATIGGFVSGIIIAK